jgi:hypothetical protein
MSPQAAAPRGPGRPPLPGERVPLGLRVTKETKLRLDQASHASGRSQSQEAEFRLEQTFSSQSTLFDALDLAYGRPWTGLLLLLAQVAQLTGTRALGASAFNFEGCEDWVNDPYSFDQAARAIAFALEAVRPRGKIVLPIEKYGLPDEAWERLGEGFARNVLGDLVRRADKEADSRADRETENSIVHAIRQRLGKLIGRVRVPPDTLLGSTQKKRKGFWRS